MSMWNPWRGCKKCSDGCLHCYIHKGDYKRGINTSDIVRTKDFGKPIEKLKNGSYKLKSGMVYLCFSTDFFIEEADEWDKGTVPFVPVMKLKRMEDFFHPFYLICRFLFDLAAVVRTFFRGWNVSSSAVSWISVSSVMSVRQSYNASRFLP